MTWRGGALKQRRLALHRAATVRFSTTDRLAKISRSWATQPMPDCARRCGARRVMSVPRHTIAPRRSWVKPIKVSSKVLLPTPFRPSTARLPRSGIAKLMSSSTTASPYPARTFLNERRASTMHRASEINLADAGIGGNLVGRAFQQDAAADHHNDAAGEAKHQLHG